MSIKIFNYLFYILYLLFIVRNTNSAENCTTPNGEAGECVPVKLCSIFHQHLQDTAKPTQNFYNYLHRSHCGFIKFESYYCCSARHITKDTEVTSTISNPTFFNVNTKPTNQPSISPPLINPLSTGETSANDDNVNGNLIFHLNANLLEIDRCGIVNSERISNGNKTELNEYAWMALLQYDTSNGLQFKCGGSLITSRYVLTAAHCVHSSVDKLVSVRLGEHYLNNVRDCDGIDIDDYCAPPVEDIGVEEIIKHSEFQRKSFKYDIALIRLKRIANIQQDNIKLICLPLSKNFNNIKITEAIVSGWGFTEKEMALNNELLQAVIPLKPVSVCKNYYKLKINIGNSELCGGGEDNIDTCYGDSGGPLFAPAKISQQEKVPLYYQIGIVSSGFTQCGFNNTYTIYTKVTFYMNWILDNLRA